MSTPQLHTDPLSSTHRFHKGPHLFSTQNPSIQHQKPLSSTSKFLSSTPKTPQFHTKNPSVPLLLSSTPKTPQFQIKNPSVKHQNPFGVKLRVVLNWGAFGVVLRNFWEGEEFLKKSGLFYGTDVLNWWSVELRGPVENGIVCNWVTFILNKISSPDIARLNFSKVSSALEGILLEPIRAFFSLPLTKIDEKTGIEFL